jgi:hypothetical protein
VVAVQAQPEAAETITVVEPPPDVKLRVPGLNVYVQAFVTVRIVVKLPDPWVAATVTPVVVAVDIVVAVNCAELLPAKMVTDPGTLTNAELLESVAVKLPEVTLAVSAAVQVLDWPPVTVAGAHHIPDNVGVCCTIVTIDPEVVLVMSPPTPVLAIPLESCTLEEVSAVEAETVSVTVATTPLAIGVWLTPYNTQVDVPATLLQETVFPAAVAALPAATLTAEKSVVE